MSEAAGTLEIDSFIRKTASDARHMLKISIKYMNGY
jgi:hypothetical protein